MKLILGLGNPEQKYTTTRHNIGFRVVELWGKAQHAHFLTKDKFKAELAEVVVSGEKVLLAKPTTYYNLVGESYRALVDFYKLAPSDVLVVHDELALPFGTIRVREKGSDAGNNGIKSILARGGDETARLRIGVASDHRSVMGDSDFVLGRFSIEEEAILRDAVLPKALELIDDFVANDHIATSHTVT